MDPVGLGRGPRRGEYTGGGEWSGVWMIGGIFFETRHPLSWHEKHGTRQLFYMQAEMIVYVNGIISHATLKLSHTAQ